MPIKIGVNLTRPNQIPIFKEMLSEGVIDYIEILVDNFLTCDPTSIRETFGDCEINLHIMQSRFLERDSYELELIAIQLRNFIKIVCPKYISDHVASFSLNKMVTPLISEVDYSFASQIIEKALAWQMMLGEKLLLENFPSQFAGGDDQIKFFQRICSSPNLGLLFDISNAEIADLNGCIRKEAWLSELKDVAHFHVGGFSKGETSDLFIDSHDRKLASSTIEFIRQVMIATHVKNPSLTVEFDHNISYDDWKYDLSQVRLSRSLYE